MQSGVVGRLQSSAQGAALGTLSFPLKPSISDANASMCFNGVPSGYLPSLGPTGKCLTPTYTKALRSSVSDFWFDDLVLDASWTSPGRTLTEADVVAFCGVSGDFHPLHTDAEYAARSRFGARLVHGALVLSVATGQRGRLPFVGEALVAFVEIRAWVMRAPVHIGDTVRTRTTLAELRPTSDGEQGVVVQRVEVLNQRDEVVHEGEMVNVVRRRVARC